MGSMILDITGNSMSAIVKVVSNIIRPLVLKNFII
ncbi:hypothetical protein NG271_641 [Saccharomyces cerevisiae synthetic construct]|uniref:Uncharacterized protein YDR371C-A n=2 Tax=Saccharomyces cerevisiae TaxID=4932 RepID=YD371_YEAST|nr:RecName: Full=Uncharacterized protein YDR371C-A [Saccharomyces cerevisiae S288C]KZV12612.1 hypothetical protein WN66_01452 [Saccharomyces cerevisiae]WNF20193.1 hypothetical protein NG271_641 [Saccharomyces cerevisiae synthetic construct]CAY78872.1 EC1118_1D0_6678p [Saccharomyces cerevisiae EC1118]